MDRIAVVGLGYVGLPVAVAFAKKFPGTLGFDIDAERVARLARGEDASGEVPSDELTASGLAFSCDEADLDDASFFVVAVPTPIDSLHRPNLEPLKAASETVGRHLSKGAHVVYESTVYPGVTEDVCGPILERASGLVCGRDFKLGYSPERINPGDVEHTFERIRKVVAGQDAEALEVIAERYAAVVDAGVHRASSIQVAESAKVIENVQRDLNIALMNELAMIFDRLGIDTHEVLDAAATKWNFHRYHPGLVGGHCIGVDPYYLTSRAEQVGFHPQVILAGRRINDGMGAFVAQKTVKLLVQSGRPVHRARIGVLGVAFKADLPDIRNSRVPDIVDELVSFGIDVLVHDPLVDASHVVEEYGIELAGPSELESLDAIVLATPHRELVEGLRGIVDAAGAAIVVDVLGAADAESLSPETEYWRL